MPRREYWVSFSLGAREERQIQIGSETWELTEDELLQALNKRDQAQTISILRRQVDSLNFFYCLFLAFQDQPATWRASLMVETLPLLSISCATIRPQLGDVYLLFKELSLAEYEQVFYQMKDKLLDVMRTLVDSREFDLIFLLEQSKVALIYQEINRIWSPAWFNMLRTFMRDSHILVSSTQQQKLFFLNQLGGKLLPYLYTYTKLLDDCHGHDDFKKLAWYDKVNDVLMCCTASQRAAITSLLVFIHHKPERLRFAASLMEEDIDKIKEAFDALSTQTKHQRWKIPFFSSNPNTRLLHDVSHLDLGFRKKINAALGLSLSDGEKNSFQEIQETPKLIVHRP